MAQSILTISYGGDSHRMSVDTSSTIQQIVSNSSTKAVLGYGDNVKALVGGVEQSMGSQIGSTSELVLETRANEKAS